MRRSNTSISTALLALGLALALGAARADAAARRGKAAPAPAAAGTAAGPAAEATGQARRSAETLFGRYQDLEHAFDPALVDLYADDARIESRIVVSGRPPTVRKWSGSQYKDLLRRALQKAKEKKQDYNYYTAVTYQSEGERVRIKAQRWAELQKAMSPVELLVGPSGAGAWRIFEEISESHPVTVAPTPKPVVPTPQAH
jgi:hypothetical protein